jgi:hypothetical protein
MRNPTTVEFGTEPQKFLLPIKLAAFQARGWAET